MADLATLLADYEREGACSCSEAALLRIALRVARMDPTHALYQLGPTKLQRLKEIEQAEAPPVGAEETVNA